LAAAAAQLSCYSARIVVESLRNLSSTPDEVARRVFLRKMLHSSGHLKFYLVTKQSTRRGGPT